MAISSLRQPGVASGGTMPGCSLSSVNHRAHAVRLRHGLHAQDLPRTPAPGRASALSPGKRCATISTASPIRRNQVKSKAFCRSCGQLPTDPRLSYARSSARFRNLVAATASCGCAAVYERPCARTVVSSRIHTCANPPARIGDAVGRGRPDAGRDRRRAVDPSARDVA